MHQSSTQKTGKAGCQKGEAKYHLEHEMQGVTDSRIGRVPHRQGKYFFNFSGDCLLGLLGIREIDSF